MATNDGLHSVGSDNIVHESNSKTKPQDVTNLGIEDFPDEVLEHILSYLSPYKGMDMARLVSKRWLSIIKSIVKQRKRQFDRNLAKCNVKWIEVVNQNNAQNVKSSPSRPPISHITDRFSHSAVYWDNAMYVFGGCTSTNTTFNDLWKFDLTTRQWVRPVAMGTYPSPKACATMVVYNGNLVLYGGWSHPIPYPLHQSAHYFSELHVYNPGSNRWQHVFSVGPEPEALGGHSASVVGHLMVVFGGSPRPGQGTNNVWVFDFRKTSWKLQPVSRNAKPEPRYGQFQTTLDDHHILMMGGCVGPNRPYNDAWLLTLNDDDLWEWSKVTMLNQELSAPQTWCHAACCVKDRIVVISKSSKSRQTKNVKPRVHNNCNDLIKCTPSVSSRSPLQPQAARIMDHSHCTQAASNMEHHHTDAPSHEVPSDNSQSKQGNLLAIQQKLHRDCMNLEDPDNHHHNPQRQRSLSEPDGDFLRIQNRWAHGVPTHQHAEVELRQNQQVPHREGEQPAPSNHQGQPLPVHPSANAASRSGHAGPSIRPNASCNRQKQLEALQRQEELLRSKSRALAAARKLSESGQSADTNAANEVVPDIIQSKNRMDAHILDISRVLTEGVAEWLPLSELQPPGAPEETICCSLVEGRGEFILFGGVVREASSSIVTNTAISRLYLLQA